MSDNELIANFMGYKLTEERHAGKNVFLAGGHAMVYSGEDFFCDEANYNPQTNWNYLIPVVEKIHSIEDWAIKIEWWNKIRPRVEIYSLFDVSSTSTFKAIAPTAIEATYKAVVAFIMWYNKQPK